MSWVASAEPTAVATAGPSSLRAWEVGGPRHPGPSQAASHSSFGAARRRCHRDSTLRSSSEAKC